MNASTLTDINTCTAWTASKSSTMPSRSNDEIKIWLGVTWAVIGIFLVCGLKTVGPFTCITTPVKWILLFVCLGLYLNLEKSNGVVDTGAQFYFNQKGWPIARINETANQTYKPSSELKTLYKDAYN